MNTINQTLRRVFGRSIFVFVAVVIVSSSATTLLFGQKASAYTSTYYIQKVQDGRIPSSWTGGFQQSQQVIKRGDILYYADMGTGTLATTQNGVNTVIAGHTSPTSIKHDAVDGVPARDSRALPFGIEIGSDGTVYMADAYTNKVWRIGSDGNLYTFAGNGQAGDIEDHAADMTQTVFNDPNYIKYGPDGLMYVSDGNMVRRINADGSVTRIVGKPMVQTGVVEQSNVVEGGLAVDQILANPSLGNKPQSNVIDFDSQGRLYVGTKEAVYRVDADGTIHTVVKANLEAGASNSFTREDQPISEKVFPTPFTGFSIDRAHNDDIWLTMSRAGGMNSYDPYATLFRIHDGIVSSAAGVTTVSFPYNGQPPAYGENVHFQYVSMPFATSEGVYFFSGELGGYTAFASIQTDHTPPIIEPVITSTSQPHNGWYTAPATLSWSITDPETAILSTEHCESVTFSYDTQGAGATCYATSIGGTDRKTVSTIPIDLTPATVGLPAWSQNPKPLAGTSTATIHASDGVSGVERAEYFIGTTDPGEGNGTSMDMTNHNGQDADFTATFGNSLPPGVHQINMRVQNHAGLWSPLTSDYLTVFDTTGPQDVAASKQFVPNSGTDVLPGMPDSKAKAKLGFDVFYTSTGTVDPASELTLNYETGHCNGANPTNCHITDFVVNSISPNSFASLLMSGQNSSISTFTGQGTLTIDGSVTYNPFKVVATDGNRATPNISDKVDMYIYPEGSNPATASPLYQVHLDTSGNWVKIQ